MWFGARVLTAGDASDEIWVAAGEMQADPTAGHLAHALPDDAVVTVLGWPDEIAEALPRRGDVEVLAVDTAGEASGFVSRLWRADMEATDVPQAGLGAAVAASSVVLLESTAIGPTEFLAVSGSRAAAAVARHAGIPVWLVAGVGRVLPQRMWDGLRDRVEVDEPVGGRRRDRPPRPGRPRGRPARVRVGGRRPAAHRLPDRPRAVQGQHHLRSGPDPSAE